MNTPAPEIRAKKTSGVFQAVSLFFFFFFSLFTLFLFSNRPLVAEPWQWADDGLYAETARAIVSWPTNGFSDPWLGEYTPHLLSKSPGFACVVAVAHLCGLPLRWVEYAPLFIACFVFMRAIGLSPLRSPWIASFIVFILGWSLYFPTATRLVRQPLSSAFVILSLTLLIGSIVRARDPKARCGFWFIIGSLSVGISQVIREENVWIYAPFFLAALWLVLLTHWKKWGPVILSGALLTQVPSLAISFLNWSSYGVFFVSQRTDSEYMRVYKRLATLKPHPNLPFVVIDQAQRLKVYEVSPTLRELQPFLEGPLGDEFASNPGHLTLNRRPANEREFFVSTLEFSIQRAVFAAGYRDAMAYRAFFKRANMELDEALAKGQLMTSGYSLSNLAPIKPGDLILFAKATMQSLWQNLSFTSVRIRHDIPENNQDEKSIVMVNLTGERTNSSSLQWRMLTACEPFARTLQQGVFLLSFAATAVILAYGLIQKSWNDLNAAAIVVLCASLCFAAVMACLDVWGFAHLRWNSAYNAQGICLFNLFSAVTLASTLAHLSKRAEKQKSVTS